MTFDGSRSLKVINIGAIRQTTYDFPIEKTFISP